VYIRRVVLENVRGFDRLDFRFDRPDGEYRGWTVITGDNASGKTTLLKAIAIALVGPDSARSLQPSFQGWVRSGYAEAVIAVEIVPGEVDHFSQGRRYERPFMSELSLKSPGGPVVLLESGGRKYWTGGLGPKHGPWAENPAGWFCSGYGPFRRLYGESPSAQRVMSTPGRVARFVTMFREDATLGECELWLTDLSHKKLEGRPRETNILEQVLRLLNDEFLRNGVRVDKVDSDGLSLRDSSEVVLPLADMSEGYRAALAMLVDILRHMVNVYGHENLVTAINGHLGVPHPGVVLIDEMDSHLHPEWQRTIGFWLKERFPNVQFIVTTHSAMICQAADENGIFHLPAPGAGEAPYPVSEDDYWNIVRSKPDTILLSPAFGLKNTRSPRVVTASREYARLAAKESAGALSDDEAKKKHQLGFLVRLDEDGDAALCAGSDASP
jgi:energy-coupling factor transporter ATP-binding protein EcfA2